MKKRTLSLLMYLGALVLSSCEGTSSSSSFSSSSSESEASSSESSSTSSESSSSSTPISSSSSESSSSSSQDGETLYVNVKNNYPFANDNENISDKIVAAPASYFDCTGLSIFYATATKIFANAANDALRFASSTGDASLSLTFSNSVTVSRITLDVATYNSTDAVVTVSEGFTEDSKTIASSTTEVSFDFAGVLANNTLTISSLMGNRFYLYGITLVTSGSSSSSSSSESSSEDTGEGFYKASSFTTNLGEMKESMGYVNLPSTGTQKMLVIPVNFTDYGCANLSRGCSTTHSDIETTFFGSAADTGWESVASYYSASSYGNLTLTGTVTPWFTVDKTRTQLNALTGYGDPTYYVLRKAVEWYKVYTGSNLTEYDQNGDGYLDAVWLVYATTYSTADDSIYWAYTFWDYQQTGSVTSPVANVYAWASYNFMWEGGYSESGNPKVDAHTYIHETGHVLGLDDYYTYDTGDWGAAGGVDMMDYNIVDHNAYSKMALGWTLPYVTDGTAGEFTITLNSFESSGDCLILKNDWNGSPLDEYLLIEFYTPTGINELDSSDGGYPGNGLSGFTIPGIKIYHIDSRMGTFNSSYDFVSFTDTIVNNSSYYTDLAVSNTASYSYANENYKLVHLLEAGKTNTFKTGDVADDDTLFFAGRSFSPSTYANFFYNSGRFDDNTAIGYSLNVSEITSTSATLRVTKVA